MREQSPIKVAVTGAAGQICYNLLFRLASGEVFGPQQPVILHLVEVPGAIGATEGVAMELGDCAFASLADIKIFDDVNQGFDGVHWAILVGSRPRSKGMERAELIRVNGPIFEGQGKALEKADESLRCVVVGNPCNTNALITLSHAKSVPSNRFFAMTALDENRAKYQLALKAKVPVAKVEKMAIWGNHSTTMVPDYENAIIDGSAVSSVIHDALWLKTTFIESVQNRGMKIIEARAKSSAASAASACVDTIKCLIGSSDKPFSAGVLSDGNPYGIAEGIVYSFPLVSDGVVSIADGFAHSEEMKELLKISEAELLKEKQAVIDIL